MPRRNRGYKKEGGHYKDATYKLIVGEGKAEEQYFNGLLPHIEEESRKRVKLKVFPYQDSNSALKHLLNKAIDFRATVSDFEIGKDEVWIVADKDLNSDFQLKEAVKQSLLEKFNLAISTPCFEIWLLLHLSDLTATHYEIDPTIEGKANRKAAQNCEKELRKVLGSYNKTKIPMDKFLPHVQKAIERARGKETNHDWPIEIGTKVYKVIEKLAFKS